MISSSRLQKTFAALVFVCLLIYAYNVYRWRQLDGADDDAYLQAILPVDGNGGVLLKTLSPHEALVDPTLFQHDHVITYERLGRERVRKKKRRRRGLDEVVAKVRVKRANCSLLFRGDSFEQLRVARLPRQPQRNVDHLLRLLATPSGCRSYLHRRHFIDQTLNEREASFPLAFSLIIYKDFLQFERLLRAIYRPHNYYCIHVDLKSDPHFRQLVRQLASCFPGGRVFVTDKSFDVQWAKISVLQSEVLCMEELWRRFAFERVQATITPLHPSSSSSSSFSSNDPNSPLHTSPYNSSQLPPVTKVIKKKPRWRYFINLTGQEFPLRTNYELVRILERFAGANNVEGTTLRMHNLLKEFYRVNKPFRGVEIHKGSVHVVLSREFVDFMLHHPLPSSLLTSLRSAFIPDEYFFSTLNYNPLFRIPGSFTGDVRETDTVSNRFVTRFKNWASSPFAWPCKGMWVRQICNFGIGDLPLLSSRDELFANKFDSSFEPLAYDCMEEALFSKIRNEYEREYADTADTKSTPAPPTFSITAAPGSVANPNKTNPDHLKVPGLDFSSYGDVDDGTFMDGAEAFKLSNYLNYVRPLLHAPLHVDMDHYQNLSFVKQHLRVPQEWVFLNDNNFHLRLNHRYNQTRDSYLRHHSYLT